jgi:hypothetical protein
LHLLQKAMARILIKVDHRNINLHVEYLLIGHESNKQGNYCNHEKFFHTRQSIFHISKSVFMIR